LAHADGDRGPDREPADRVARDVEEPPRQHDRIALPGNPPAEPPSPRSIPLG
jgi:hypothetical protein